VTPVRAEQRARGLSVGRPGSRFGTLVPTANANRLGVAGDAARSHERGAPMRRRMAAGHRRAARCSRAGGWPREATNARLKRGGIDGEHHPINPFAMDS